MSDVFSITREIHVEYGHRLVNKSKCANVHGHRGVIQTTLQGVLVDVPGDVEQGMITDFSALGDVLSKIAELMDHRLLIWEGDFEFRDALSTKAVAHNIQLTPIGRLYCVKGIGWIQEMSVIPTAENLARVWCDCVQEALDTAHMGVTVKKVVFHETAKCWASYEV